MENKTKNRKNREEIEAMVKRSFNGMGLADTEDAITELKEGWFNVAYNVKLADGRESILKIAPPVDSEVLSYEKNIMNTEVNMMRLAGKETDVKVPEVYYYYEKKDVCDSDYFFMEKLTGNNYGNVKETFSEEMNSRINYQIGESLRMINSIEDKSYFGYDGNPELRGSTWRETYLKIINAVLENGKRKQVDIGHSYDEVYGLIESHSHYLDAVTTPHFVHWDCWDSNVFVQDGNVVGIIDFERVLWADILLESIFRTMNADQLAGYGKTEFTYDETVKCKLYDAYLNLVMIIECYYRSYDKDFKENLEQYALKSLANNVKWLREND
jgi:aminoglycoside phosphotransferase (APT) family kinase protein